jgi:hypothetical protein
VAPLNFYIFGKELQPDGKSQEWSAIITDNFFVLSLQAEVLTAGNSIKNLADL